MRSISRAGPMRRKQVIISSIFLLVLPIVSTDVFAQPTQAAPKISSRYAKVFYQSDALLRLFNKRIRLGSLSYLLKRRVSEELSLKGQVSEKIDIIVERVETILEMRPKELRFDIIITPDADAVRSLYKKIYHRDVEFLAFYSPLAKAIYVSADDIKSKVLAHEIAHAVIDQYFGVAAPIKIHEILADYVTENFEE